MPRPGKRAEILEGGLAVFARDGFTRASIDAISAEAQVSTRTIYNHFWCKADLFQQVIEESAGRVAEAQLALLDRHLGEIRDVEADLIEFGVAWLRPVPDYAQHFALVRHVNAERGHIPQVAIDAWQEAGPFRVQRALAGRLRELADRGVLRIDDADRAALHFSLLISGANPSYRAERPAADALEGTVAAGVRAFLYGYSNKES